MRPPASSSLLPCRQELTRCVRSQDANQTVRDMKASKARYRYVLVNTANGGKL